MRKTLSLGLLALVFSLLLAACGRNDAPAPGGQASVSVKASFPAPTPPAPAQPPFLWRLPATSAALQAISGQGVPGGATSAELKVYSGAVLVASQTLTPTTPSATLSLPRGQAYRFSLSVRSYNNNEIAWGETTVQVEGDTSVDLSPQAILDSAYLGFTGTGPLEEDQAGAFGLLVSSKDYTSVGPDDYEVSYTLGEYVCDQYYNCTFVEGDQLGTVEASNKLGVRVRAKPGSGGKRLALKATVSGLGADHQPTTIEALTSLSVLTPTLPTDDGVLLGGTVVNWSGGTAPVRVQNNPGSGGSAVGPGGSVAADGALSVSLPAGNNLKSYLSSLSIEDGPYCTSSWEQQPGSFNAFQPYFAVTDGSGTYLGELILANRDTEPYQAGWRQGIFLYSDRAVSAKGTQSCDFGSGPLTYSYDFTLQQGWNLLVAEYTASGGVMTGGPFSGTLPEGLAWYYRGESPGGGGSTDASVGVSADLNPPSGGVSAPGSTVAVGTPVSLSGNAYDNAAVQSLELFVDFEPLPLTVTSGTLGSSSNVSFSATWTPSSPGYHRLDLVIRDKAGNSARSYTTVQAR